MRRGVGLLTLILGVLIGYLLAIVVTPGVVAPSVTPEPGPRTAVATMTSNAPATSATTAPATPEQPAPEVYLVWSTGGMPAELVEGLEARFEELSVVRGDSVELDGRADWVIPLDGLAIDPDAHAPFDDGRALSDLVPGTVGLSSTSASFREVSLGDDLSISGASYRVIAIVPDEVVGAAEVVFASSDSGAPVITDRFALVRTDLARNEFERVVRDLYDGPAPLRIRSRDETPWLRHGDAVLPQILIKTALGEFSYANRSGSAFSQDPAFIEENIVNAEIPILGGVTCHKVIVEMLRGAMSDLVDRGLAHLVDPAAFAGCWNPRYIEAVTGRSAGISRHAWGAAVDLNASSNPVGSSGTQDPRLVEVMSEWGFTWGGDWLVPDPMHFEYGIAP